MAETGKTYDAQRLSRYAGLDTEKGIKQAGSKLAYFHILARIQDEGEAVAERLGAPESKTKLLSDLSWLSVQLKKIYAPALLGEVDALLAAARKDGEIVKLGSELSAAGNSLLKLCEGLAQSEGEESEAGAAAGQAAAASRPRAVVKAGAFSKLMEHFEQFELEGAEEEIRRHLQVSYDAESDRILNEMLQLLEQGDFEGAYRLGQRLLTHALLAERAKKREKKKILAVDDVPDILNTLKRLLQNEYNIYCVTSYLMALKFVEAERPDLILLDIEMPEMNGFDLLKILRNMEASKKTPVLFLTGNVSVENIKTSMQLGGDDFIRKPVDYEVLSQKIKKNLRED